MGRGRLVDEYEFAWDEWSEWVALAEGGAVGWVSGKWVAEVVLERSDHECVGGCQRVPVDRLFRLIFFEQTKIILMLLAKFSPA